VVDFLLVLIEFFAPALTVEVLTVEALLSDIGRKCGVRKGWVIMSANFRVKGSSTNDFWR